LPSTAFFSRNCIIEEAGILKELALYTRPTCSDCQEAKKFLKAHDVPYVNVDLSKQPEKEAELIRISGTRIVPAFVFKDPSIFKRFRKPDVLIGFENNFGEIKKRLDLS